MKKFFFSFILILTTINIVWGTIISPDDALNRFIKENHNHLLLTRSPESPKLIKQISYTTNQDPNIYIFASGKDNIVLSGSDKTPVLLGYFDNSKDGNLPEALDWWLKEYSSQISFLESNQHLDSPVFPTRSGNPIGPLLTTQWNQQDPYNLLCPIINGYRSVTGCVATAFAQVMNYHKWPLSGEGSISYTYNGRQYSMDFSEIEFDWNNMLDSYSSDSSEISKNAVATLMKACGYAVEMGYGLSSSGAVQNKVLNASKFFNYSDKAYCADRQYYTSSEWENMIIDQLSKGLPIIYGGRDGIWSNSSGHCFVLDGYDGSGYFHFNWGWGGYCDGYFLLSFLVPSGAGTGGSLDGYNYSQECCIDFFPNKQEEGTLEQKYMGKNLTLSNISSTSFTIASELWIQPTVSDYKKTAFGIEFISCITGEVVYINELWNIEFASNNNYWNVNYNYSVNQLKSKGLTDGEYIIKFVYKSGDNWIQLPYPINTPNKALLTLNNSTLQISLNKVENYLKISNVKFNDGTSIIKGIQNTLTYEVTNDSDEPLFLASLHYLRTPEQTTGGVSLYNINLIVDAHETKTITLHISASKINNITNGNYYLAISIGNDFNRMEDYYSPTTFRVIDTSECIKDDHFIYAQIDENKVCLLGLANPNTRLSGDVLLPDVVSIEGNQYNVISLKCNLTDLLNISELTSLDIRTPIDKIEDRAFWNCVSLKKISLPSTLEFIGKQAFDHCFSLTEIIIPDKVVSIESYAFNYCKSLEVVNLPDTIMEIKDYTFNECENLRKIKLPKNLNFIGNHAFANCKSLETLNLPESLRYIGSSAFYNCSSLSSELILSEGITTIESYTFYGCLNIEKITLPSSLELIKTRGFSNCESLKEIIIPDNVILIEDFSFYSCRTLEKVKLPINLNTISRYTFAYCDSLSEISFPSNVTCIEVGAFTNCKSLAHIDLPPTLISLGNYAFSQCPISNTLYLPENLEEIGDGVFYYNGIPKIVCKNPNPPVITTSSFSNKIFQTTPLFVPEQSLEKYKEDDIWGTFYKLTYIGNIIVDSIRVENEISELRLQHFFVPEILIFPEDARNKQVVWSSSRPEIATISAEGVIEAKKVGTTLITATATDVGEAYYSFTLKIIPLLMGDSNDNGIVTVADAVNIANYAIGKKVETFLFDASDVNKDGNITMSDASATISIVLKNGVSDLLYTRATNIIEGEEDYISFSDYSTSNGASQSISIDLFSINNYVAIQGEILLPYGMEFMNLSIGETLQNTHFLTYEILEPHRLRFVIFSIDGNLIPKNVPTILKLSVKNKNLIRESPELYNVIASDDSAKDYYLSTRGGSGSDTAGTDTYYKDNLISITKGGIIINSQDKNFTIYNLSGMVITSQRSTRGNQIVDLPTGIYIVVIDNESLKVVVK